MIHLTIFCMYTTLCSFSMIGPKMATNNCTTVKRSKDNNTIVFYNNYFLENRIGNYYAGSC